MKYRIVIALQELKNVEAQPRFRGVGQAQEYISKYRRVLFSSGDFEHISTWFDKILAVLGCISSKEEESQ